VELTEVGRTFVEEARLALLHIDRAVQLGHAAREGSDSILTIGHSPDADQAWLRPNPPIANAPAGKHSGPRGRSAPAHLVDRALRFFANNCSGSSSASPSSQKTLVFRSGHC
jgi:hypothetical protein